LLKKNVNTLGDFLQSPKGEQGISKGGYRVRNGGIDMKKLFALCLTVLIPFIPSSSVLTVIPYF
jgi:hypothetical protein